MFVPRLDIKHAVFDPHVVRPVILQFLVATAIGVNFELPLAQVEGWTGKLIAPNQLPSGQIGLPGRSASHAEDKEGQCQQRNGTHPPLIRGTRSADEPEVCRLLNTFEYARWFLVPRNPIGNRQSQIPYPLFPLSAFRFPLFLTPVATWVCWRKPSGNTRLAS